MTDHNNKMFKSSWNYLGKKEKKKNYNEMFLTMKAEMGENQYERFPWVTP